MGEEEREVYRYRIQFTLRIIRPGLPSCEVLLPSPQRCGHFVKLWWRQCKL